MEDLHVHYSMVDILLWKSRLHTLTALLLVNAFFYFYIWLNYSLFNIVTKCSFFYLLISMIWKKTHKQSKKQLSDIDRYEHE